MPVVVKDRVWSSLEYEPHPGQKVIHDSLARHRVASCGRRFGKSTLGGHELVPEAAYTFSVRRDLESRGKQRRFWIGGPDYSDCEKEYRVIYNDLKRLKFPFDHPGTYDSAQSGNMRISLWGGLFVVETVSAKIPDSWDGEGLAGILLVEAAKLKELMWGKYVRPALADERGWSLSTSTPEGKNWFYKHWQWGQSKEFPSWRSWRMPSWINPKVFPRGADDPEVLAMRQEMSAERFNQQVGADFTDFVGRVFKDFDEEVHVRDVVYRPDLPLYIAIDYGWTNPFVCLAIQVDVWDNVSVIGEYRRVNRDINDIGRDLMSWPLAANASTMYPDPASPGDTAVLSKLLRCSVNDDTGGPLKWRLEQIRKYLKLYPEDHPIEKRQPKLLIDRSCAELIREMLDYRYPDTKEEASKAMPEEPMDKDDHGPEALGRFFRGYYGPPEDQGENRGHARVRKARVG